MDELNVYLQDHWAVSAAGLDLAERVARTHRGEEVGPDLEVVAADVRRDREALRTVMRRVGLAPAVVRPTLARAAERLGRLKPNGHLLTRSPASDVLELEALQAVVATRRAGWVTLLALADDLARVDPGHLEELRDRAEDQLRRLAEVHAVLARSHLARRTTPPG